MSVELEANQPHGCENIACKCQTDGNAHYCNQFCQELGGETSSDDRKCGCGHMACDITKQLGNADTFAATGS